LNTVETTLVRLQQDLAKMVGKPNDAVAPQPLVPVGGVNIPMPLPGGVVQQAIANGPPDWVKHEMAAGLVRKAALLREQVAELPLAIKSQKEKMASFEKQLAALKAGPPSKEVLEEVEKDPDVMAVDAREKAFRAKYQREMALYSNPNAESVQATLAMANQAAIELKEMKEKKAYDKEFGHRQGKGNELAMLLDDANRKLRDLEDRLRADTARLAEAEVDIAKMPSDPTKPDMKPEKPPLVNPDATMILAQDDIFRDMAHNAAALRMDIGSPRRVSVLQKASMPMQKDTKKQILVTVFAGLLGFGFIGLVVVGYEAKAKKVSSLSDLKGATPVPVVGVLPWQPGDSMSAPDVMESIDKLRSYVAQTWLTRGATTVAVTSPMGGEGTDFTAFGLASSLATAGYKTLLVDFDLRQPSLHTLAGVANNAGVCELLRGESDFRSSIQRLPNGLHFLGSGKWSEEARSAAVGGRLESLLSRLKEPFDCVVLHAHALLTAAESVEVARRCEVVLLCSLHRETRTPFLKRATERVATMEVPYSGIVYLGATPHEALC
jgi:Mrp family chromosome partitioning ATPase